MLVPNVDPPPQRGSAIRSCFARPRPLLGLGKLHLHHCLQTVQTGSSGSGRSAQQSEGTDVLPQHPTARRACKDHLIGDRTHHKNVDHGVSTPQHQHNKPRHRRPVRRNTIRIFDRTAAEPATSAHAGGPGGLKGGERRGEAAAVERRGHEGGGGGGEQEEHEAEKDEGLEEQGHGGPKRAQGTSTWRQRRRGPRSPRVGRTAKARSRHAAEAGRGARRLAAAAEERVASTRAQKGVGTAAEVRRGSRRWTAEAARWRAFGAPTATSILLQGQRRQGKLTEACGHAQQ